jgi:uncharacterized protein YndB with AHSA1/START domain
MMTTTELTIRKRVTANVPPEQAFRVFTEGLDKWWLRSHHIGASEMDRAVLEPREGGRWYEIGVDGTECDWGHVIAWDPPHRLVLAWQINANWQYDPDLITEVEVRFVPDGAGGTTVELEHRDLDRYGPDRDRAVEAMSSEGGWPALLNAFAGTTSSS